MNDYPFLITVAHGVPSLFILTLLFGSILLYFVLPATYYLLKSNRISIKIIAIVPICIIFSSLISDFSSSISELGLPHCCPHCIVKNLFAYGVLLHGAICILFLLYKFIKKHKSN